jgi:hypothetical protein
VLRTLGLLLPSDSRPRIPPWNELDPASRAMTLEILARLIAQASAEPFPEQEAGHDD